MDIWENSGTLKQLCRRDGLLGNCGVCDFRNVCGGCRARAYAYTGNINRWDPGCIRNNTVLHSSSLNLACKAHA
ncbi:MAG: hypothetical protein EPN24_06585 [Candidatus Methanoperedens sp.]|nr:MAG: hypothetical protein EPN24_06585 [Candidatus Methanoperedens sp.]